MGKVRYIVKKRMREAGISGHVNLPYGTEVEAVDGLYSSTSGRRVRATTNKPNRTTLAFAGRRRRGGAGALTLAITSRLEKRDQGYQDRWDLVWEDATCQKYRRADHEDHFLVEP